MAGGACEEMVHIVRNFAAKGKFLSRFGIEDPDVEFVARYMRFPLRKMRKVIRGEESAFPEGSKIRTGSNRVAFPPGFRCREVRCRFGRLRARGQRVECRSVYCTRDRDLKVKFLII